ncbi:SGNH/GDSL hydrolase family protein [Shewanella sp. A14]
MLYQGVSLILAPLLVFQGLKVRRTTPKLPEPQGDRVGKTATNADLSLLILGDSAAAGVGVTHQKHALLGQLIQYLRPQNDVNYGLFAKTGATTASTLTSLNQHITSSHPILGQDHFDVIITSLGVNDITSSVSCHHWLAQQTELLTLLTERYRPKLILVTAIPPLGLFPALPNPLRWALGQRANQFNQKMHKLLFMLDQQLGSQLNVKLINLPLEKPAQDITMLEYMGQVMANDGFHPGPAVYTAWAKLIAEQIQLVRHPQ